MTVASASAGQCLNYERDGAQLHRSALLDSDIARLRASADIVLEGRSGVRLFGLTDLQPVLDADGSMGRIARGILGEAARPVRAVMFDKTEASNWAVHWHQDRTIAVKERRDVPGFGPWTSKSGIAHVEPPFEVIASMITLRAHLDDCSGDNAPLLIAPGSHRVGRVAEPEVPATVARLGQAVCLAAAGDVWLYATSILHASERAREPCRRRVLHVDFARVDLPGGLEWLGVGSSGASETRSLK